MPSLPRKSRSGDGPAPEPGSRRDSADAARRDHPQRLHHVVDVGVAAWRSGRRTGWPASRRAWRTRTTAGSARSVSPCGRSCSSSCGPNTPAWMRAARLDRVDLQDPVEAREVDGDRAGAAVARAARRRRPPSCRRRRGSRRCPRRSTSRAGRPGRARARGRATRSGTCRRSPVQVAHHVAERLAVRVPGPVGRVGGAQARRARPAGTPAARAGPARRGPAARARSARRT